MRKYIRKMNVKNQLLLGFSILAVLLCAAVLAGFYLAGVPFGSLESLVPAVGILVIVLAFGLFVTIGISRGLDKIIQAAERMAQGNADPIGGADSDFGNNNDFNRLLCLFQRMSNKIRDGVSGAKRVAEGDFTGENLIRPDNDLLAISLKQIQMTLNGLYGEISSMAEATRLGDGNNMGNPEKFAGSYRGIIEQVNRIIDDLLAPVKATSMIIGKMNRCDLQSRVTGSFEGQNNQMKDNLNNTLDTLNDYIGEIRMVLTKMAQFDLTVQIDRDYKGDFVQLKDAINLIIQTFNQLLTEIRQSADQVESGSRQISDGSQSLSSGSTQQAASIAQLTTSVSQLAEQIRGNAADAAKAGELAETGRTEVALGNRHMEDLQEAMSAINESSANISKIIKVIEDIAFQTNILALNAAVEAARAGQHGKGFAVVADEVRTLAVRSADAASETARLIEDSINRSNAGSSLAGETTKIFRQVVDSIAASTNHMNQIAAATKEQAHEIARIDQGIRQVSDVVQANSATAEESAASSQELSAQASQLQALVSRFTLAQL